MRIAFYGSSLLSSYWNGAATYYRGIIQALSSYGYKTTFYEPDAFERQSHRDIEPPSWAQVEVYSATISGLQRVIENVDRADIVVKASGVGVFDDELVEGLLVAAAPNALRIYWDVDAPATLATLRAEPEHMLRRNLGAFDLVLTYGGGPPVVDAYRQLGARSCVPIYNALDPAAHFRVAADPLFAADLAFLANRLPDRETRVQKFFLDAADCVRNRNFLLGGSGWDDKSMPGNVRWIGHVPTALHNVFNSSALAVLNVARDSMAQIGFSPATRVFEAAGAGACIITDAWDGIEHFLEPDREILVARDGNDVAAHLAMLTPQRAAEIGQAALLRCLSEHTYAQRAQQLHGVIGALRQQSCRSAAT